MFQVSGLFKQYASLPNREFDVKAIVGKTTYLNDNIMEFDIGDSLIPSEDFTLGTVISSSLNISIRTIDTIPSNAMITPYVRLNGDSGYTEWIPLGSFYIDSRKYQNNVWVFSCFDKLILTQKAYVSMLAYPATMVDVMTEICTQLGLTLDPMVVINPSYTISSLPSGCTYRDVIGGIVAVHGASTKLGKDGNLKFIYYNVTGTLVTNVKASDYFTASETNPLKTYTKIMATYNQNGDMYVTGDLNATTDNTLSFYSPFITQAILNSIYNQIKGFYYMPFTMDWKGLPYLEVGDTIQVTMRDGTIFSSTILINKLSFKGGLKFTTSSPSLSANNSEFNFGGTIKQYVQSVADDISQSIMYYSNQNAITVNTTSQKPVYLSIAATKDTNLKLFISIYGQASVANLLTIEIQLDNGDIVFTPKQKTQPADNIIGIPLLIPQLKAGGHYIGVLLKTDTGTFTIPAQNLQVTVEGGSLQGGLSAEYPHAEVIQPVIWTDVKGKYTISETVNTSLQTPMSVPITQNISQPALPGNISLTTSASLYDLFEETNANIVYTGTWTVSTNALLSSNGTAKKTTVLNSTAKFNFTGTSLEIMGYQDSSGASNISINIDGVSYAISQYNSSIIYRIMQGVLGLVNKAHCCVITNLTSGAGLVIDAICLDTGCVLQPYQTGV